MIYNQVVPMFDMVHKMLSNGDKPEQVLQFVDTMFPDVKKSLLLSDIKNCANCNLFPCNHSSFEGPIKTDIMFVGEAPGEEEEKTGRPFVGPSGEVFDNMLSVAESKLNPRWARDKIFLTNAVKCRPTDNSGKNRRPDAKEIAACKRFIDKEIELVNPKLIICVGSTAANTLIHPGFKITEEQGKIFGDETKMIAMFHPSYVLYKGERSPEGIAAKKAMWQVLVTANEYMDSIAE